MGNCAQHRLPAGHSRSPASLKQNGSSVSLHSKIPANIRTPWPQCSWSPTKQSSAIEVKITASLYTIRISLGISNCSKKLGLGHRFLLSWYSPHAHYSHKIHFTLMHVPELHKTPIWTQYCGRSWAAGTASNTDCVFQNGIALSSLLCKRSSALPLVSPISSLHLRNYRHPYLFPSDPWSWGKRVAILTIRKAVKFTSEC